MAKEGSNTGLFFVVGLKQVLREMDNGVLGEVYLAKDADKSIREQILEKCKSKQIPVKMISSMKELGQMAKIEVKAAVAATAKTSD